MIEKFNLLPIHVPHNIGDEQLYIENETLFDQIKNYLDELFGENNWRFWRKGTD